MDSEKSFREKVLDTNLGKWIEAARAKQEKEKIEQEEKDKTKIAMRKDRRLKREATLKQGGGDRGYPGMPLIPESEPHPMEDAHQSVLWIEDDFEGLQDKIWEWAAKSCAENGRQDLADWMEEHNGHSVVERAKRVTLSDIWEGFVHATVAFQVKPDVWIKVVELLRQIDTLYHVESGMRELLATDYEKTEKAVRYEHNTLEVFFHEFTRYLFGLQLGYKIAFGNTPQAEAVSKYLEQQAHMISQALIDRSLKDMSLQQKLSVKNMMEEIKSTLFVMQKIPGGLFQNVAKMFDMLAFKRHDDIQKGRTKEPTTLAKPKTITYGYPRK